ncbi:MAG: hypothetical protein GY847_05160 [Proteobacteria bacterium]|nr:hypothetical protein [Pseudomonadota bacterium]
MDCNLGMFWDGGTVQAYNGSTWSVIRPTPDYSGNVNASGSSIDGLPGFSEKGNPSAWHEVIFNITGYANTDFQIRFCLADGQGSFGQGSGWSIDWVQLEVQ